MMKRIALLILGLVFISTITSEDSLACSNFLITKGATIDGSSMISYSADSHVLYGELYHYPAMKYKPGAMLDIYEWDTGKYLGQIEQVPFTYNVIGNINEHQVSVGETTYGGREELVNPNAILDYGSLIYLSLQRSKNAREVIYNFVTLTEKYGYYSEGESLSISDANEVWIMEIIGKGPGKKGIAFVARRIPDGYICGHANQARITTFPLANGTTSITSDDINKVFNPEVETVYASDVISLAREHGWFNGADADFSFCDAYAPITFEGARACEARVWSGFNKVNSTMGEYVDYAMGYNLKHRMPLWIKPDHKLSLQDVFGMMRDYYQNTPMDLTKDLGAGPYGCTVRWRPMEYKVNGESYIMERAISTQQTGFSFIAQSRNWLPDPIGGISWFGVDDTYYTVYTPMYCGMTKVPHSYAVGNGDIMTFSDDAGFWVFNQMSNFIYTRTSVLMPEVQAKQKELETNYIAESANVDKVAAELYKKSPKKAIAYITDFSVKSGDNTVSTWRDFYRFLFVKYMDGNVKTKADPKPGYKHVNPNLSQPGYPEEWYKRIVEDTGDKLKAR